MNAKSHWESIALDDIEVMCRFGALKSGNSVWMENIFGEWRKLNEKRESLEIRNKYLKAASRIQRELNANLLFI